MTDLKRTIEDLAEKAIMRGWMCRCEDCTVMRSDIRAHGLACARAALEEAIPGHDHLYAGTEITERIRSLLASLEEKP